MRTSSARKGRQNRHSSRRGGVHQSRSEAAQKAWKTKRAKAKDYRQRALKAWETKRAKAQAMAREFEHNHARA